MSCRRTTHLLLFLLLAVTLLGAAAGDVRGFLEPSLVADAGSVVAFVDPTAAAPEREDSAPRADKICKLRMRESTVAASNAIESALAHATGASHWLTLAQSLVPDSVSFPAIAACSSHACSHASHRLHLKLQLGQAP